jgi:hypothetical protein
MQLVPLLSYCARRGWGGWVSIITDAGEQMSKQGGGNKGALYLPLTSNGDWLDTRSPEAPTFQIVVLLATLVKR